jgi:hypothetical protein
LYIIGVEDFEQQQRLTTERMRFLSFRVIVSYQLLMMLMMIVELLKLREQLRRGGDYVNVLSPFAQQAVSRWIGDEPQQAAAASPQHHHSHSSDDDGDLQHR